ncbi:MAG: UvrD-helicase domain-containing protein, partial [Thermodesulfobacteriota bacterium]
WEEALQEVDTALETLSGWWRGSSPSLEHCFIQGMDSGMFKKSVKEDFNGWWQHCSSFFSGDSFRIPPNLQWLGREGLLGELNGNKLRGEAKKVAFLEEWPLADGPVSRFLEGCEAVILGVRIELARQLQTGLRQRLSEQGRFSFDELIVQLARALSEAEGEELQSQLAARFQVALIDEFQDTDAAQYRIFSTLFGGTSHYLFLIGDPKQAIYKFRGADIHAYFQARKSASQLLGLEKNYRSSPLLVEAVNSLFLQKRNAFVNGELPYHEVSAAKSPESWRLWEDDTPQPAMVYCCLESPAEDGAKPWTSGALQKALHASILTEIRRLLAGGSLETDRGEMRRVTAGDVAILVRTNRQAEEFQQILTRASIPAIMSSRKSVFATKECEDLLRVATAVASPGDEGLLRTAMSCEWFGLDGRSFLQLSIDEQLMDEWMARFHDYHRFWHEQGFLAMMNKLFLQESVFENLCQLPLAERRIVNLNHLVELVQEAESLEHLGLSHSLQYLSAQMDSGERLDEAELRLESDEQAVKVVTMHAVKGLEYPIVFCPYLYHRSARLRREKNCVISHDEQGQQVADLGSADFLLRRERAMEEELAEEVRLLYVALTRASCRCYVFWADVKGSNHTAPSQDSALSWVLSLDQCPDISSQVECIGKLCDGERVECRSLSFPFDIGGGPSSEGLNEEELQCRSSSRASLSGDWLMTSYSALAALKGSGAHVLAPPGEPVRESSRPTFRLPMGAGFGNVVHGLLEDYPFSLLAGVDDYEEEILGQCRRFGVSLEPDQLMGMLREMLCAPLTAGEGGDSFSLLDPDEGALLKEMPFYFHLRQESTERINALLAFSDVVLPVEPRILKGYLTGFVDLVCRYRSRYYIMDYKSNFLGETFSDYGRDALVAAMREHNYGLQYWIYTLVLHRYLANAIPGYSYEHDFGGVFYLFTRGMSPDYPGNGVYFDRPDPVVLDELQKSLGAG